MTDKILISALTVTIFIFMPVILNAQDRLFTYTYQSNVLESGQKEMEIWNTYRTGRVGLYNRLDTRAEFEVGLGKNIQTAFYLNHESISFEEITGGIKSIQTENNFSFANEWKYKISDPVANPLGFAIYGEYTVGVTEYELESKLIFDKKIKNFTVSFNLIGELDIASGIKNNKIVWEREKKFNISFGLAYPLSRNFHLTFESFNNNIFGENDLEGSALFAGLGLSYFKDSFWLNFTVLPQITSFKGATNDQLNLKNFEKLETRLIFSYAL